MAYSKNAAPISTPGAVDIPGYEGRYQATECGDIYSSLSGKKMRPGPGGKGYLRVVLWKDGVCKNKYVHRLVAETWLDGFSADITVNHKDGNKKNNHIENIELVTLSENIKHSHRSLPRKRTLARNYKGGMAQLLTMVSEWKSGMSMYGVAKKYGTLPGVFRDQLKSIGALP
jgi:hypothetical protein